MTYLLHQFLNMVNNSLSTLSKQENIVEPKQLSQESRENRAREKPLIPIAMGTKILINSIAAAVAGEECEHGFKLEKPIEQYCFYLLR